MKNLLLTEMLILSAKEKKARRIKFHKQLTVILGKNDTGKSALIKSIYHTFGANVKFDDRWENAATSSLVRFSIDQVPYIILRWGKLFGLFENNNKLIGVYESISEELGPALAQLLDFKMVLNDRKNVPRVPPPAYFLLPYYIDQDKSWAENWSCFENLGQFDGWRNPTIEYHTGLKPNEYYLAKSELDILKDTSEVKRKEINVLKGLLENLNKAVSTIDFNTDIKAFEKEVTELIDHSSKLQKDQLNYKKKITDLYSQRINLENQQKMVSSVLSEIRKDIKFVIDHLHDEVDCPTCGAHYNNSFRERFTIAEDENKCLELFEEIKDNILSVNNKIKSNSVEMQNIYSEINKVDKVLTVKKGELALRDIIENEGKKQMQNAFAVKIDDLSVLYFKEIERIVQLNEQLKNYSDKERRAEILGLYRRHMRSFLYQLDVNMSEAEYSKIESRIGGQGSAKPRGLLSYYYSVLHIIRRYGTSTFCPIIIDEPDQQGQDKFNMPKMLSFIIDNKPNSAQLVLGLQDTVGVDIEGAVVEVDTKYSVLIKEHFEDVSNEMTPLINSILANNNDLFGGNSSFFDY